MTHRKTMTHNNLHYLAAVTILAAGWLEAAGPLSPALAFKVPDLGFDMPRPVENRGSMSFGWMSVSPEAGLLRRARNLAVYVLHPNGALKRYNDGPMSASIQGYLQEAGESRVTT